MSDSPENPSPEYGLQDHIILRADASLRGRHPYLETEVFEVVPGRYLIACSAAQAEIERLSQQFDREIRPASAHVQLSNERPQTFVRQLRPLTDAQAASKLAGLSFRQVDLLNLLLSRFPNCGVRDLTADPVVRRISLKSPTAIGQSVQIKISSFIQTVGLDWQIIFEIAAADAPSQAATETNPMFIWAAALRPHAPVHVQADEAFWFDRLDEIASGALEAEKFPGMKPNAFRCFLDLSLGREHINLRQTLLLYDEVWCSLPLARDFEVFLAQQQLSREDLLSAITEGRLRVVTTQPEERLDIRFLEAVAERDPMAIFGRRKTAALLVADVARTAKLSQLNDPEIKQRLVPLAAALAQVLGGSRDDLTRELFWPLEARRASLQSVLDRGSKGGPVSGLAAAIAAQVKAQTAVDVELELLVYSEAVHIGHALSATVVPGLDQPEGLVALMSRIGDSLNFHRSFNGAIAASWASNERRRYSGFSVMPTLPLFEFEHVPMDEFLQDTRLGSTRQNGRALMARLATIPDDQRADEVRRLVNELRTLQRQQEDRWIDFDFLDTGVALAALVAGLPYPPLAGLAGIGKSAIESLRNNEHFDRLANEFGDGARQITGRNSELDFLSQIKRVAQLKRQRI